MIRDGLNAYNTTGVWQCQRRKLSLFCWVIKGTIPDCEKLHGRAAPIQILPTPLGLATNSKRSTRDRTSR
jgi:hypothetical protein